jgi:hypothetical protein
MNAKHAKTAYKRIYDYEFEAVNSEDKHPIRYYTGRPVKHGENVAPFQLKQFDTGVIAYIDAANMVETLYCEDFKIRGCWIHKAEGLTIRMIYIEGVSSIDRAADVIIGNLKAAKAMRRSA